ncbi:hypothetical protein L916_19871 [Phytophthora nicotianae]|uniref:Uncharacterized protein n=1 Tax=Phytophthora nicotianae TaxID=4792 RepID=W2HX04_PHYNI|nr:hypothetical protein L916_19871 [Phytophthora nicotianae]
MRVVGRDTQCHQHHQDERSDRVEWHAHDGHLASRQFPRLRGAIIALSQTHERELGYPGHDTFQAWHATRVA